jgi:hypothetical protein
MAGGTRYFDILRNVLGTVLSIEAPGANLALSTGTTAQLRGAAGVEIESSTAEIRLGFNAVAQPIDIGTAGARVITIGNALSTMVRLASSGAIALEAEAGTISIGANANDFGLNIGTGGARVITIGVLATTTGITLQGGAALNVESLNGAIGVGTGAYDFALGIGTAGIRTIAIGNVTATSLGLTSNGGITLEAQFGPISIGVNPANFGLNIGTGGARVITIGVLGATTGLTLQGGAALNVESVAGAIGIGTGLNPFAINIGTDGLRAIAIGNALATSLGLAASGAISIEAQGAIGVGNDAVNHPIDIGIAGARAIAIGGAGATSLALDSGGGGLTLDCNTSIQARQRLLTNDGVAAPSTDRVVGGRAYVSPAASAPVANAKELFSTGAYNIPAATLKTNCTLKWKAVVGVTGALGGATVLIEAWFGGIGVTLIADSTVMVIGAVPNALITIEGILTVRDDASAGAGTMTGYMTSKCGLVDTAYIIDVLDVAGSVAGTYTVAVNNTGVVSFGLSALTNAGTTTVVLQDIYVEVVG